MEYSGEHIQQQLARERDVLRRAGLKLTHQRLEIYHELAGTNEHPDAETIYRRVRQRMPTISLDTVYRTLRVLEKHGLIIRAGTVEDRGRFDANINSHQHFICSKCGRVMDIFSDDFSGIPVPDEAESIGQVRHVHVEFRGICRDCATS